jgi:hypothetical protein
LFHRRGESEPHRCPAEPGFGRQRHVGCRVTQRPAEFLTVLYFGRDRIAIAEQSIRPGHIASRQRLTDPARGHHFCILVLELLDQSDAETMLLDTGIHEIVRIAFAALAEMEIVTCDDMMNTQPLAQGSGDEVFGALGRKLLCRNTARQSHRSPDDRESQPSLEPGSGETQAGRA